MKDMKEGLKKDCRINRIPVAKDCRLETKTA